VLALAASAIGAAHEIEKIDAEKGNIASLVAAIKSLVSRPQPPIQVHVEAQPAPVVHVAPPNVTVKPPDVHVHTPQPQQPRSVRVEVDDEGVKRYIPED
jgi:hypothetical protein